MSDSAVRNIDHPDQAPVPRSRIVVASMIGTSIEFFDFYIYATAAVLVFPVLFFPKGDDTAALLSSFATFGLAFVARPIGSILFGHFGDRIGRKATLVGSLLTMGIATFVIGLLPTYDSVGYLAPALLALMRFCQGLGLGGEWSGAALLATETAEKGKRAWAAMWPQLGAPIGFFFANGTFLLLMLALDFDAVPECDMVFDPARQRAGCGVIPRRISVRRAVDDDRVVAGQSLPRAHRLRRAVGEVLKPHSFRREVIVALHTHGVG